MRILPTRELPPHMTLKRAMFILQDGRCPYCGRVMVLTYKHDKLLPKKRRKRTATFEHLHALHNGGSNSHANQMLACKECNSRRGDGPACVGMFAVREAMV